MSSLDTPADKAVRDAVDAFMEGRLTPEFSGETVFETKNSRYRLLDGVVFAAPDDSLLGAELVGWLMETSRRSVVGSAWQPGARAVLVDRNRGRNIIVTSTTRLLHLEQHISNDPSTVRQAVPLRSPLPPAPGEAPFAPQRARIIPSTPPPPAAVAQRRAAAVHLPPRPIAPANPTPLPVPARPLPVPAPPPRREPSPAVSQVNPPPPSAAATAWELTSSEFEMEAESQDTLPDPEELNLMRHDAAHHHGPDSGDAPTDDMAAAPESGRDAPIPLVKAILPLVPPPRR